MFNSIYEDILQSSIKELKASTPTHLNELKKLVETTENAKASLDGLFACLPLIEYEVLATQLSPGNPNLSVENEENEN